MIAEQLRRIAVPEVSVSTPTGRLVSATGPLLQVRGVRLHVGQRCRIESALGADIEAQVVGFKDEAAQLMAFKRTEGLAAGARVLPLPAASGLLIGDAWSSIK